MSTFLKTSKNILFIVPPKVHLLDLNGPAHIFYEAKEFGMLVELHFVSVSTTIHAESSAGLSFSNLKPYVEFELSEEDYVFVPGLEYTLISDSSFIQNCDPFFKWLRRQASHGAHVCSVCTGAFLLAEAGLLSGKSCTTHWKYLSRFSQKYPAVYLRKDRLFVVDGNLYTSAGVASGIDLALYIIEKEFGTKWAIEVAKEVVVYFRRSEGDPQLSIFLQYRNHMDSQIHEAQNYLMSHLSGSSSLESVAEHVNMSIRNLTRCFKKTTGITIGDYLEKLRVERAVQLLSTGNKVEVVSKECGLSPNQLRALLKKHRGVLPGDVASLEMS
ncbi:GlxA family transcriptional regulator [Xanthocytophaga flava]|uniref:GlxA family transcriptional regulator n=1 Tax=Xanthocytophaga flava TaxID=3048013 RepID=UPI0028D521E8|nr:DJ-1/PfpI family protein [Xanthocytophaga flavus]